MVWQPLNLASVCVDESYLTACSNVGYVFLSVLVQLYGHSIDRQSRKKKFNQDEDEYYDFIVVGGGSSGCVVANRLSEITDWKVLLLEAGPEQPDVTLIPSLYNTLRESNVDWGFYSMPNDNSCLAKPKKRCKWASGKMMGGTSSLNSMLYLRGDEADYNEWAAMGNVGWKYEDVLPYFKKSERNLDIIDKHLYPYDGSKRFMDHLEKKYHGFAGYQPVSFFDTNNSTVMPVMAFAELGLPPTDFSKNETFGSGQAQSTTMNGVRVSTNHAFIRPIRNKRKNLEISPDSKVVKVLIKNNAAYGVKLIKNGIKYKVYAKKEVILCAGAINSAKLLLLSGIGPVHHLEELNITVVKDLPVGENLQTHVSFEGLVMSLPKMWTTTTTKGLLLKNIFDYKEQKVKKGLLAQSGPIVITAFSKSNKKLSKPDIQYLVENLFRWHEYWEIPLDYGLANIFPTVYHDGLQLKVKLLTPKSRGRVRLNITDRHGPPVIQANIYDDPIDIETLIAGARFIYRIENTGQYIHSGVKFIKTPLPFCENFLWGSDEYSHCLGEYYTTIEDSPVGTCKMGLVRTGYSVVNSRLKVYGVKNLRVIDASIMPVITRGSVSIVSMMIGEKGADMIKEDWISSSSPSPTPTVTVTTDREP